MVAILALLGIRQLVKRRARASSGPGGRPVRRGGVAGGSALPWTGLGKRRQAKKLAEEQRFVEAGELYEEAGQLSAALDAYLQGGASSRVARLLEGQGELQEAARAYEAAEDYASASRLWVRSGQPASAARCYEKQELFAEAARMWKAAGQPELAAEAYLRKGELEQAGLAFQQAEQPVRAAEAYLQLFEKLRETVRTQRDQLPLMQEKARLAARMFEAAELPERALEVYRNGGLIEEAVRLLVAGERPAEAGHLLLEQGRTDEALPLLEQGGEQQIVWRLKAQQAQAAGELATAAEFLLKCGEPREAANLLREAQRWHDAAQLYLKTQDPLSAAQCLEAAGERPEAAAAHEAAGNQARALELYRGLGRVPEQLRVLRAQNDHLGLARLLLAQGDEAGAKDALKAIGTGHQDFRAACRLLGEIYWHHGDAVAAAVKYRQAQNGVEITQGNLEHFYTLGLIAAVAGQPELALSAFESVLEVDPTYRDTQARIEALRGKPQPRAASGTTDVFVLTELVGPEEELAPSVSRPVTEVGLSFPMNQPGKSFESSARTPTPQPASRSVSAGLPAQPAGPTAKLMRTSSPTGTRTPTAPSPTARSATPPGGLRSSSPTIAGGAPRPGGAAISRYQLLEPLGHGGLSEVYRARDLVLDREVAYKRFPQPDPRPGGTQAAFLKEARAVAKLNHVNVVTIFDAGEEHGLPYIAMELVDGENLAAMVSERGPLGIRFLGTLLRQCCDALGYAHERGIIHRDIKPANMMWTTEGILKITDFGLARIMTGQTSVTPSQLMGTPFYMSPEQILGEPLDPRTDIYSLGITFFELTCGRVPFATGKIIDQHLHATPSAPSSLRPECPAWLDRAILWCLKKDRSRRPHSARELWRSVEREL